jgi:endogenous inhibitor of DNA gyrase (YacG/DUF329 family)
VQIVFSQSRPHRSFLARRLLSKTLQILASSIHNQKRAGERMNEIFCDVNSRNARMNQWQGRWPESIKMRFDCGIRCRNQLIKRGHDNGLSEISIVGQGGQTAHRQDNNHECPLQSSNGSHTPTLPMCTAECKTVDVAGARTIAAGRPSSSARLQ